MFETVTLLFNYMLGLPLRTRSWLTNRYQISVNWYVSSVDLYRKLGDEGGEDLRVIVLGLDKNRWPEVRQVMLQHLKHQVVLTWMMTWMTSCPPNHGLQHMMFPPVHEPRSRKERKRKARGSSSHTTPPAAPPSVNWDDDLDDFMSWSITYDVHWSRLSLEDYLRCIRI